MNPEQSVLAIFESAFLPSDAANADYTLLMEMDGSYVARSRGGLLAFIVPMKEVPGSVGRRSSGCELIGHASTQLTFQGRTNIGPAAGLLCIEPYLVETFVVLALDILKRKDGDGTWSSMLAAVEEWQTLLAPQGKPSVEKEMGLWGELWFLAQANDIDRLIAGWRGPEGDATDFFIGGRGVEVKTSRFRRQHHVSHSQVDSPVGNREAWFLSAWVKPDPGAPTTAADLADGILGRSSDRGDTLRRLARAGYSPAERNHYSSAFVILTEPEWYAALDVPRVRLADPGVSHLRYRVSLDESRRANGVSSDTLWRHFHGHSYGGAQR
jgi:hypothetical protein